MTDKNKREGFHKAMLENLVNDLIQLADRSKKVGDFTFILGKYNSVFIDGIEYSLKLEKRG